MTQVKWRQIGYIAAIPVCVALPFVTFLSHRVGICYAGSYFCWSLTDGCLVLPLTLSLNPAWGPWGFWTQRPWGWASGFGNQINSPTISIPLILIYWCLLFVALRPVVRTVQSRIAGHRPLFEWTGNSLWVSLLFVQFQFDREAWMWIITTIALPAILLVFIDRRSSHTRRGNLTPRCGKCRYNLTGNVSGTCPECGTPIPKDRELASALPHAIGSNHTP